MKRFTATTITSAEELAKELQVVNERGYAIDNAEHEDDVMCVAVPLWNHRARRWQPSVCPGLSSGCPRDRSGSPG